MLFSSLIFLFFFLPLFLGIYYLVPFKYKNFILLIFSLFFYAWGEPIYILLLIFSSIVDFCAGKYIYKYKDDIKKKRLFLLISLISNIGLLVIFKYCNFITHNLFLLGFDVTVTNIALPLGVSFFTFQTMSYSIDVYFGRVKAEKNFLNFMTYVSMFPQLVAGPIVRYEDIAKELKKRTIKFKDVTDGFFLFLTGLFKKVLIANNVGYLFTAISSDINSLSLLTAWLGIVAFALQIYFDFSGYSDMAMGIGRMIGFTYPKNFNYPYIAKSITEFWRRWHISLSTWFKDYVYIPLGGNRCGISRNILNILIVWTLTGIWHGASWNFILWGLYFAFILILEKTILKNFLNKLPRFIQHIYTILLILISWTIFAFEDFNLLLNYFSKLFLNSNIIDTSFIFYVKNYFIFLLFGVLFSIPIFKKIKFNNLFNVIISLVYIVLFIITVAYLISDSYNPFLYFRF